MKDLYFVTDLDRTIIHSKNEGFKCVEKMGEREITYMTESSHEELMEILKLKNFKFIPCTMRNIRQTLRVDFIREYNPQTIICTNGAQIYINGELDSKWNHEMRKLVNVDEIKRDIKYIEDCNLEIQEVRNIEDFYITVKCENEVLAKIAYDRLKDKFNKNIRVMQIGAKVFFINENIDKINAVDYIIDRFKIENLITSGDSEVDRMFTTRGISILPKHCSFKSEKAIFTERDGIYSTDDLINILKKHILFES